MWGRRAQLWPVMFLAAAVAAAHNTPLPDGPGRKTIESACAGCHTLDVITGKKWGWEKWQDVVQTMDARRIALSKTALSTEETSDVVGYLARHFGPQDRGKILVEEICSFCHGVSRIKDHAFTRDEWNNVIKGMVDEGAPVTDAELSLILDYLTKNFGPPPEQGKEPGAQEPGAQER
jgi:cytochrome c5